MLPTAMQTVDVTTAWGSDAAPLKVDEDPGGYADVASLLLNIISTVSRGCCCLARPMEWAASLHTGRVAWGEAPPHPPTPLSSPPSASPT